jgi:hypothetical protein
MNKTLLSILQIVPILYTLIARFYLGHTWRSIVFEYGFWVLFVNGLSWVIKLIKKNTKGPEKKDQNQLFEIITKSLNPSPCGRRLMKRL